MAILGTARPTRDRRPARSSTPSTACPRCPSTSVHTPAGGDFSGTTRQHRVEHRHAGDPRHGAGDLQARSCTSPPRSQTPSSPRRWRLGQRPRRPADHERVAGRVRAIPVAQPDPQQRAAQPGQRQRRPARSPSPRPSASTSEPATTSCSSRPSWRAGRSSRPRATTARRAASPTRAPTASPTRPSRSPRTRPTCPLPPASAAPSSTPTARARGPRRGDGVEYSGGNASPFITRPTTRRTSPTSTGPALDRTASRATPASSAAACPTSPRSRAT